MHWEAMKAKETENLKILHQELDINSIAIRAEQVLITKEHSLAKRLARHQLLEQVFKDR